MTDTASDCMQSHAVGCGCSGRRIDALRGSACQTAVGSRRGIPAQRLWKRVPVPQGAAPAPLGARLGVQPVWARAPCHAQARAGVAMQSVQATGEPDRGHDLRELEAAAADLVLSDSSAEQHAGQNDLGGVGSSSRTAPRDGVADEAEAASGVLATAAKSRCGHASALERRGSRIPVAFGAIDRTRPAQRMIFVYIEESRMQQV